MFAMMITMNLESTVIFSCQKVWKNCKTRFYTNLPTETEKESCSPSTFRRHQQALCVACHVILVLIHVGLLGVWLHPHSEHAITFPISSQGRMASLVTAMATAIGTVLYSSVHQWCQLTSTFRDIHLYLSFWSRG
jgi:hypothetical protein